MPSSRLLAVSCALAVFVGACGEDPAPTAPEDPQNPEEVTEPTAPAAPTNLAAVPGDASVELTFTPGADGGSPITNYEYELDGATWVPASPAVTGSPLVVSGLTNGVSYSIRIRAVNEVGAGAPSGTVTFTPVGVAADSYVLRGGKGEAYGVAAFPDGSAIVVGRGSGTFGSTVVAGPMFVAKAAPDGTWSWALSPGGSASDYAYAVVGLPDGGALVAGQFAGTAQFGSHSIVGDGLPDAFVARVDASGEWLWATRAGGDSSESVYSISLLPDGDAVVTGSFSSDDASFGATTLSSLGQGDVFVARIDADGEWVWATRAGGANDATGQSISAVDDGAVVTGFFTGTQDFGVESLTASGGNDVFVAKIDLDGSWLWASQVTGGATVSQSVSSYPDGSSLVSGYFFNDASFGATTLTSEGVDDAFVARISSEGEWVWAVRAGGNMQASAQSVTTMADGGAIVTGYFTGAGVFGGIELTGSGGNDIFIAGIDGSGAWLWANRAGGTAFDLSRSASVLTDGSIFSAGSFRGPATFGSVELPQNGSGNDVYVARLGPGGVW